MGAGGPVDLRLAPTEAERRPGTGLWIHQIFFLKVRKDFGLQDRDYTFVLHIFLSFEKPESIGPYIPRLPDRLFYF